MTWHVLDANSPTVKEFAYSLSRIVPTRVWAPDIAWSAKFRKQSKVTFMDPPLEVDVFPLQRGYAHRSISFLSGTNARLLARLLASSDEAATSPLICTSPFYAPVAERWPGPVIYYQIDFVVAYENVKAAQIRMLDRQLCRRSTAVCVSSARIADYMVREAACRPDAIEIVPNATRAANILSGPAIVPGDLPEDLSFLPRPVVGVIGNMAGNIDWCLLEKAVALGSDFSWAFVGPADMRIRDRNHSRSRARLMTKSGNVAFVGAKPYGTLQRYARAFDVALMPYRHVEPTFSGSPGRFYEHLAACRPILSTRAVEQLLSREHTVHFVDTPGELVGTLEWLRGNAFVDGKELARWRASKRGTWEKRAEAVIAAFETRTTAMSQGGNTALQHATTRPRHFA